MEERERITRNKINSFKKQIIPGIGKLDKLGNFILESYQARVFPSFIYKSRRLNTIRIKKGLVTSF